MTSSIDRFVADLVRERCGTLVNQYAGGASIRCENLRAYLEPRIGARFALIGEATSAHGARFSGIAFTAERSLLPEQRTSAAGLHRNGFTEHSATIVRGVLEAVHLDPTQVVLWNAVPFHPPMADDPLRNRRPTEDELALGARCSIDS